MTLQTQSCFHPMWWGVVGIVGVDILQTSTASSGRVLPGTSPCAHGVMIQGGFPYDSGGIRGGPRMILGGPRMIPGGGAV